MSRVVRVETAMTTTQLTRSLRLSHGARLETRQHVIVRLTAEDGTVGYGEASPLTFLTGETVETTVFAVEHLLAPTLLGHDAMQIAEVHRRWRQSLPGHPAAKCAVDIALHDLVGRSGGVPVAALLGGASIREIPMYKAIGIGTPEEIAEEAHALLEMGLRGFKLKIGNDLRADLESLRVLRDVVGDSAEITVDGNEGYSPLETVQFLRKAEPYNIAYIEQPVARDDISGLAFIRSQALTPVMADEGVFTLRDVSRLIAANAVDLLGIKLIKTAGMYHARHIVALAEEHGIHCVVISPFDTELGVAASAQFAATLPSARYSHGFGSFMASTGSQGSRLTITQGRIAIPSGAGLGIEPPAHLFQAPSRAVIGAPLGCSPDHPH